MKASLARRLDRCTIALIAMSAPTLQTEPRPMRPPMATAPLAQSLSLRELVAMNRLRQEVANAR